MSSQCTTCGLLFCYCTPTLHRSEDAEVLTSTTEGPLPALVPLFSLWGPMRHTMLESEINMAECLPPPPPSAWESPTSPSPPMSPSPWAKLAMAADWFPLPLQSRTASPLPLSVTTVTPPSPRDSPTLPTPPSKKMKVTVYFHDGRWRGREVECLCGD